MKQLKNKSISVLLNIATMLISITCIFPKRILHIFATASASRSPSSIICAILSLNATYGPYPRVRRYFPVSRS